MSVKIRLSRAGAPKKPFYRVVVADSRMPRDGRFIEVVGHYDPRQEPSLIQINEEKVRKWLARGAKPSNTVRHLLDIAGIRRDGKEAQEVTT